MKIGIASTTPMSRLSISQSSNDIFGGVTLSSVLKSTRSIFMDNSNILHFSGNGNDGTLNASGVWTDSSDIAYKENISELRYGLSDMLKLSPKQYTMKVSNIPQIGLIAQDVEKVIPEVVSGEEGHKGIAYGQLIAIVINAVKELSAKVDNFIANGIANIKSLVVDSIKSKDIESDNIVSKKICLGTTCVTEDQLKALLLKDNITPATYVPLATSTPTPVPTPSPTPTLASTSTPTTTPSVTPNPTATPTPSITSSTTPAVTATTTPVITLEVTPSPTPTPTPTPAITPTPEVSASPTPTAVPTPEVSITPNALPSPEASVSPEPGI
jgi:hypothetical protein